MKFFQNIRIYLQHRRSWESICERCGLCCFERTVYDDGRMDVDLSAPCKFYNEGTGLCEVYDKRFQVCPECKRVTLRRAASKYYLPPQCAYRRLFR